MDKVCIYGVFEFVGFHLCKRLLEKGLCVDGVHINPESDMFLGEKRLEIGRNANFEEKSFSATEDQMKSKKEQDVIIISLYDWFMRYEELKDSYKKLFPQIIQSIQEKKGIKLQLVYLLPIQLLSDWQDLDGIEDIKEFLNQIKGMDHPTQYFYLPTIFGPWQPSSFLFQRVILNQFNEKFEMREWPLDAIFVDDVLNPMIERIESGETGNFLLESGIPKSWELCSESLIQDENIKRKLEGVKIQSDEGIKKITLKEVTPYAKSLSIQKEHVSWIYNLDEL